MKGTRRSGNGDSDRDSDVRDLDERDVMIGTAVVTIIDDDMAEFRVSVEPAEMVEAEWDGDGEREHGRGDV